MLVLLRIYSRQNIIVFSRLILLATSVSLHKYWWKQSFGCDEAIATHVVLYPWLHNDVPIRTAHVYVSLVIGALRQRPR